MRRVGIFWRDGLAFCPACFEPLGSEEIGFECCDTCGGDGFPDDYPDQDEEDDECQ